MLNLCATNPVIASLNSYQHPREILLVDKSKNHTPFAQPSQFTTTFTGAAVGFPDGDFCFSALACKSGVSPLPSTRPIVVGQATHSSIVPLHSPSHTFSPSISVFFSNKFITTIYISQHTNPHNIYSFLKSHFCFPNFSVYSNGFLLSPTDTTPLVHSFFFSTSLHISSRLLGGMGPKPTPPIRQLSPPEPIISPDQSLTIPPNQSNTIFQCTDFFLDDQNSPRTWLSFHSRWLNANSITDTFLQANSLLNHLPPNLKARINNLTEIFADVNPYTTLYSIILKTMEPSIDNLIQKYFNDNSIGNTKPSDFLRTALSQLNTLGVTQSSNSDLLRRYFLQSLPMEIRALLTVVEDDAPLDKLAQLADRAFDILHKSPPTIAASISNKSHEHNIEAQLQILQNDNSHLRQAIAAITNKLNSLDFSNPPINRSRQNSITHTSRAVSRNASPSRGMVCFYHSKFKKNATKCCIGCRFYSQRFSSGDIVCIYHNKFRQNAQKCLAGCKFNQHTATATFSKNF